MKCDPNEQEPKLRSIHAAGPFRKIHFQLGGEGNQARKKVVEGRRSAAGERAGSIVEQARCRSAGWEARRAAYHINWLAVLEEQSRVDNPSQANGLGH